MRTPEKTTIGGLAYEVAPLPAGKAIRAAAALMKMAGPAFGKIAGGGGDPATALTDLLGGLADRIDGPEADALLRTLAEETQAQPRGGRPDARIQLSTQFDEHFRGDVVGLFEWARFALGVNFGPLFGALTAAAPAASDGSAAPSA